jgi:hypothetical protein
MKWRETIERHFPGALPFHELEKRSRDYLTHRGLTPETTLFANVICRDEINDGAVEIFSEYWGENFDLGGLAGFPSSGITGFSAYSHHVPDGGSLFVLFGPHVGVSESGEWGKVSRTGISNETAACGALINFLNKIYEDKDYRVIPDPADMEQNMIEDALLCEKAAILGSPKPILAVTEAIYSIISNRLKVIIKRIDLRMQIVLLGGIMINTSPGNPTFFALKEAEILNAGHSYGQSIQWKNDLSRSVSQHRL